jgi:hypothetical protein
VGVRRQSRDVGLLGVLPTCTTLGDPDGEVELNGFHNQRSKGGRGTDALFCVWLLTGPRVTLLLGSDWYGRTRATTPLKSTKEQMIQTKGVWYPDILSERGRQPPHLDYLWALLEG